MSSINIANLDLGFGAEFIPIYQRLKGVEMYDICQRTQSKLDEVGDKFGIAKRYTCYHELLANPEIHAVHINSSIPDHSQQSIKALKAGKHVACTVPMATSLEECKEIIDLCESTGLKYMIMETVVYAREFLFMKELYEKGELGKALFLRATQLQDNPHFTALRSAPIALPTASHGKQTPSTDIIYQVMPGNDLPPTTSIRCSETPPSSRDLRALRPKHRHRSPANRRLPNTFSQSQGPKTLRKPKNKTNENTVSTKLRTNRKNETHDNNPNQSPISTCVTRRDGLSTPRPAGISRERGRSPHCQSKL